MFAGQTNEDTAAWYPLRSSRGGAESGGVERKKRRKQPAEFSARSRPLEFRSSTSVAGVTSGAIVVLLGVSP